MKKQLLLVILATFFVSSSYGQAQWYAASGPTTEVLDLNVCGDTTFSVYIYNPSAATFLNCVLDVDLPNAVEYIAGSVMETTTGGPVKNVVESNISNLNRPYFTFDSIPSGQFVSFTYRVHTQCGGGGNSIAVPMTLNFTGGSSSPLGLNAVNIDKATINIVSATNQNFTGGIGTTFQQTITLRNAGLGYLDSLTDDLEVKVLLDGTSCISVSTPDKGTLSGDTLILPKSLFATIGDNDGKWENNEDLQVTYTVSVNCCNNLTRNIIANWGCDGNVCELSSAFPSNVIIPNDVPNIVTSIPVFNNAFCMNGAESRGVGTAVVQELRLINLGTGDATNFELTMYNYTQGSGYGDTYYDTTVAWAIRDANKNVIGAATNPVVISTANLYGINGNCSSTSAEPVVVKWDLGTIPAGDTIYLDVRHFVENRDVSCLSGCQNSHSLAPYYFNNSYEYNGPCGNSTTYSLPPTPLGSKGLVFADYALEMPTDLKDLDTFDLKVGYSRIYTSAPLATGYTRLVIPLGGTDLTFIGPVTSSNTAWNGGTLNSFLSPTNDTLFVDLPLGLSGSSSNLKIPMVANCGTGGTHTVNTMHFSSYDTTCTNPLLYYQECNARNFVLHCPSPCPTGGATPISFNLSRVTLGLPDDNDDGVTSGIIDSSKIEWNHAVNGDTLLGLWNIKVHPNVEPANPNNGMPFLYTFIDFDLGTPHGSSNLATTALTALPNAEVIIYPNGSTTPLSPCLVSPTVNGQNAQYDLSSCKSSWVGGDSIVVRAKYIANGSLENPGYKDYVTDNDVYSSYIATPNSTYATVDSINGERFTCDRYNGYMLIYSFYTSQYAPTPRTIDGCVNELSFNHRRYCEKQSGNVRFPFEARYFDVTDTFYVRLSTDFEYRPGSAKLKNVSIPDANIYRSGEYIIFGGLKNLFVDYGGTIPMNDEYIVGDNLTFSVNPTCDAVTGSQYTARFNVAVAGDGKAVPTTWNNARTGFPAYDSSGTAIYTYDGALPFLTGGGTIALYDDSASWNVVLNNGSNSIDAPDTWFFIETVKGTPLTHLKLKLNGVTEIPKLLNGFYQVGTNNRSSSTTYTVTGNMATCDTVMLLVHSGYGCTSYPSTFDTSLCHDTDTLIAYAYPTGTDANLQVNWNGGNSTVGFCAPFTTELTLNSTQLGDIATLDNFWLIPFGYTLDTANIEIEYPIGSGYRAPSNPSAISVSGQLMSIDYNALDDSLSNGMSGSYDTTTKSLNIKVPLNSGCGAFSGDQIRVLYNSASACGDQLPEIIKESAPIIFTQAAIPGYTTTPAGHMDTISNCAPLSTFNFYVDLPINQIAIPSQAGDSIFVTIPPGVTFNSYSAAAAGQVDQPTSGPYGPVDVGNGQKRYSWPMTAGLTTGDTIKFHFDVNFDYTQFQSCGQAFRDFVITTGSGSQVVCNSDTCTVLAINGRATKSMDIELPKLKASLSSPKCGVNLAGEYKMEGDLDLCNTSNSAVPSGTQTTTEFYLDSDESFTVTPGDSLLKTLVTTDSIPANGCITLAGQVIDLPDSVATTKPVLTVIHRWPNGNNPEQCVCDTIVTDNFICAVVLPVDILNFDGNRLDNGSNLLSWTVSNETSLDKYELYKSENQQQWNLLGTRAALNNSATRTIYMTDTSPFNSTYYRLRMVDMSGAKSWHSKIVHITSSKSNANEVMVYPNPTSGELNFVYDMAGHSSNFIKIEIVDISGRTLIQHTADLSSASNETTIQTNALATGSYILRYKNIDTGESGFVKFIKQD